MNTRLTYLIIGALVLLALPAVAMFFTDEVQWKVFDFIVAAGLLGGTVLGIELIMRKVKTTFGRLVLLAFTVSIVALVWIELAVGIFGSPVAGN